MVSKKRMTLRTELDHLLPQIEMLVDAPAIIEHLLALRDRLTSDPMAANIMTIDDARRLVRKERGRGIDCPVCQQRAKVYQRPLSREMVSCLLQLIRIFVKEHDWIKCKRLKRAGGDYAKLADWELIEFENLKVKKRRKSGRVRPTQKGVRFALAQITVPSHVLFYNKNVVTDPSAIKRPITNIMVHDVKGFDYDEIMAAVSGAENLSW